jgi:actin-related protein
MGELVLTATNNTHGVVVDSGHDLTYIIPVYDGQFIILFWSI